MFRQRNPVVSQLFRIYRNGTTNRTQPAFLQLQGRSVAVALDDDTSRTTFTLLDAVTSSVDNIDDIEAMSSEPTINVRHTALTSSPRTSTTNRNNHSTRSPTTSRLNASSASPNRAAVTPTAASAVDSRRAPAPAPAAVVLPPLSLDPIWSIGDSMDKALELLTLSEEASNATTAQWNEWMDEFHNDASSNLRVESGKMGNSSNPKKKKMVAPPAVPTLEAKEMQPGKKEVVVPAQQRSATPRNLLPYQASHRENTSSNKTKDKAAAAAATRGVATTVETKLPPYAGDITILQRQVLAEFYQKHDPKKMGAISEVLRALGGRKNHILICQALETRYKCKGEFDRIATVILRRAATEQRENALRKKRELAAKKKKNSITSLAEMRASLRKTTSSCSSSRSNIPSRELDRSDEHPDGKLRCIFTDAVIPRRRSAATAATTTRVDIIPSSCWPKGPTAAAATSAARHHFRFVVASHAATEHRGGEGGMHTSRDKGCIVGFNPHDPRPQQSARGGILTQRWCEERSATVPLIMPPRNIGLLCRATLFALVCHGESLDRALFPPEQLDFLVWNAAKEPVSNWESRRNAWLFRTLGVQNPFVAQPALAAQMDFSELFGGELKEAKKKEEEPKSGEILARRPSPVEDDNNNNRRRAAVSPRRSLSSPPRGGGGKNGAKRRPG